MKAIINDVFHDIGLDYQTTEFGSIYYSKQENRYNFWLVIETDDLKLVLENQSSYFETAKEVLKSEWFDKNANLLILYKTDSDFTIDKNQLIEIEENPYLFKKQILIYKSSELQNLSEAIEKSGTTTKKFFETKLMSNTTFEKHKNNVNNNDFESLLYRVAHKIPFLNMKVIQKNGLTALIEDNNVEIGKSSYIELDEIISEIILNKALEDLANLDREELYIKFKSIIDQNENK